VERDQIESKFMGAMVGSALGDAIGEIAFIEQGRDRLLQAVEGAGELSYTDDTAMAIGLAESLIEQRGLDPEALGRRFHENYRREPWRGYGAGPPTIFRTVEREGNSYTAAAQRLFGGEGSAGNGAAMRIAPLGLLYFRSPDLDRTARDSAAVTHAHPVGRDGAAVQARAVAAAVGLDPDAEFDAIGFCDRLIEASQTDTIRGKMVAVREALAEGNSPGAVGDAVGRTVAVHESMPFAVFAFLRHPRDYEACLMCACLNGGDRDTLGAMACAISGAFLGGAAIPEPWRERLENHGYIETLGRRLAGIEQRSGGSR